MKGRKDHMNAVIVASFWIDRLRYFGIYVYNRFGDFGGLS